MDEKSTRLKTRPRYPLLDELRGLALISMMGYHAMWDLVYLFGVSAPWYGGLAGLLWQQITCWVFILLSGFCVGLGSRPVRRGLLVFGGGALVTVITALFMPADLVLFGVLTFLGTAMILTGLLRPALDRAPAWAGLAAGLLLFALTYRVNSGYLGIAGLWEWRLPAALYRDFFMTFLGFPGPGFYSTDYFSLLPWIFLYWAGYYLYRLTGRERLAPLRRSLCPPLGWVGRHSLLLYLLHQPVLYGVLTAASLLW